VVLDLTTKATRELLENGSIGSKRDFVMFRAANEELSEHARQTLQAYIPAENSDVRIDLTLFCGNPRASNGAITPTAHVRGGLRPAVVRRLREHIDNNMDQRISVESLARLANLSVCYFVRAFKQSVGLTPHDYLIRRRVERTMELLSGTDMSLSEIALAAGFADQSHCARRFRQHVGMSPGDYRWSTP
jgi:transcriptional regulator GlxA family with amidase domain